MPITSYFPMIAHDWRKINTDLSKQFHENEIFPLEVFLPVTESAWKFCIFSSSPEYTYCSVFQQGKNMSQALSYDREFIEILFTSY